MSKSTSEKLIPSLNYFQAHKLFMETDRWGLKPPSSTFAQVNSAYQEWTTKESGYLLIGPMPSAELVQTYWTKADQLPPTFKEVTLMYVELMYDYTCQSEEFKVLLEELNQ